MCELITIAAAIAATALFLRAKRAGRPNGALWTTALALWGAAIMWSVDCVHSLMEGEGLLDLSVGDAALGGVIVAVAVALYAILRIREKRCGATSAA